MLDPLSDLIALLRPSTIFSKGISGAGAWAVRYSDFGHPGFCTVLEGSCRLAVDGEEVVTLAAGDFVLLPATPGFTMSGFEAAEPALLDPHATAGTTGEVRHGTQDGPPDVRMMGGYFAFASPDAGLLVEQLPAMIHLRGAERLGALVAMLREETGAGRPGRDLLLARLVEILLVEALRAVGGDAAPPGLLRGLADPRLAAAIRQMHAEPARAWTTAELAKEAALSRSAFFERFARTVGVPPMEYLLGWRMNLAKDLLRRGAGRIEEIALTVGYGSASAFSTAFARQVGMPPKRFAGMAGS
ncbi:MULTISPECIES: AraC family transcriptional regulator [unclassified Sphingopyxis]|uniref:AraC family transcriptional regulator n=1 Tax=unclassified Sphingopyxis TaxID=2614943 RepID=UPI0007361D9C|nr:MULTISPECIES: AraC family transcriptional regulator [unclassified Sphingopyxis]KTE36543.1 AraC family transcriptional regulator [Sphingopyxis sp. HIX]KTE84501.1 AraC family transcriptional regulator [Sphingopyxis sp. HXXIV]